MTTELPEAFLTYLAARDQERNERFHSMLSGLTERETRLIREAAVMGYVQGTQAGRDVPVPRDSDIVRSVLLAADTFDDLYPTLSRLGRATVPDDAPDSEPQ